MERCQSGRYCPCGDKRDDMMNLTFSEGFAISAGLIQGFVAVVFVRFRLVRPEWGLGWLAMAFAMAATLGVFSPVLLAGAITGLQPVKGGGAGAPTWVILLSLTLAVSTRSSLVAEVLQYVGHAPKHGR